MAKRYPKETKEELQLGAGLLCKHPKHGTAIVNSDGYREEESSPAPR
jgi:hypothetical protein